MKLRLLCLRLVILIRLLQIGTLIHLQIYKYSTQRMSGLLALSATQSLSLNSYGSELTSDAIVLVFNQTLSSGQTLWDMVKSVVEMIQQMDVSSRHHCHHYLQPYSKVSRSVESEASTRLGM